jgi:hypothetical protein
MGNKHRGEPRVYKRIQALIREGLPNPEVHAIVRKEFPQNRTCPAQVRFFRQRLRVRFKDVPGSVEARHRRKAAHTIVIKAPAQG